MKRYVKLFNCVKYGKVLSVYRGKPVTVSHAETLPYISIYKSRNLSQNKVLHRQFVLYTGNTLREEIIPKAS